MLLTVLALGGAILGATSIAGLLMLYQIRATTDTAHSAQAVFAADAGTEWAEYVYFCYLAAPPCADPASTPYPSFNTPLGATATTTCYDEYGSTTFCYATTSGMAYGTATAAIAKGASLNSVRAFYLNITTATSTR